MADIGLESMLNVLIDLSPIFLAFLIGMILGRLHILSTQHADMLLQIVVYLGLPALILSTISNITLTMELALLPVCAILTILFIWPVSYISARHLGLSRPQMGSFITGIMIMNLAFVYPFVVALWGQAGVAHLILLDFGNGLLVLTLVYIVACRYGSGTHEPGKILISVITFPPFLALIAALIINQSTMQLHETVSQHLQVFGRIIIYLVPMALGIYLDVSKVFAVPVVTAVFIRIGVGLLLGLLWVNLFDLEGTMRAVVIMGTAAPIGFNTLVYASREHLDKEFAASIASVSMLLALVYLPVIALFLI